MADSPRDVVRSLVVTYGLYRAMRMVIVERRYRQLAPGRNAYSELIFLNNAQPNTFAYNFSIHKAWMIVMGLWFLSHLDSWRGLTFNRWNGY